MNLLKQIHLQVIDRGAGFPETALPYVFERFYRGEPSRARQQSDFTGQHRNEEESGPALGYLSAGPLERSPGPFLQEHIGSGNNVLENRQDRLVWLSERRIKLTA